MNLKYRFCVFTTIWITVSFQMYSTVRPSASWHIADTLQSEMNLHAINFRSGIKSQQFYQIDRSWF